MTQDSEENSSGIGDEWAENKSEMEEAERG